MEQKIELTDRFTLVYDSQGNKYLMDMKPRGKKGSLNKSAYCGYHLQFRYLLRAFARKRLSEMESKTVKSALENMERLEDELITLAESLGEKAQRAYKG
jgi:hypothetical protein